MTTSEIELDCHWTVGQVLERYPATAAVFNRYGMDLCCGSSVSVQEAAHRDGRQTDSRKLLPPACRNSKPPCRVPTTRSHANGAT